MATLYSGFSSFEYERIKDFALTDISLVKMDLLNHIYTRKGSRVMMPTFGTIIPDLVFEPLDDATTEILEEELRAVFEFDPRVDIVSFDLNTQPNQHMITASVQLFYIELDAVDLFELNIVFES